VIAVVDPIAVALRTAAVLDRLGVVHTVGGSIAASFAGEPRSTLDIDIIAALDDAHVSDLVAALSPDFYVDEESATQLKVDLFVAGGTPLDMQQLARRRRVDLGEGRVLYVHPPEDILLQKLHWYRKGGEVSDRQWRDILGIIRTQGGQLDRAYLSENGRALGVEALLERALREAPL
jgi:hypothetical protein